MSWEEFKQMLIGIAPDTALGRIVSVRAEDRKEYLENFTPNSIGSAMNGNQDMQNLLKIIHQKNRWKLSLML